MTNSQTNFARTLRRSSTDAEKHLWASLRARRLDGFKFRRQHPIGNFIADFACLEVKLVVELDGGGHGKECNRKHDNERTAWLKNEGYTVLRFWNNEVLQNADGVLEKIRRYCVKHPPLAPLPSREGK